MIEIISIDEYGYDNALSGLRLNYSLDDDYDIYKTSKKLAKLDDGHNKFLESICVWMLIRASRDFWVEFDTYRVGVTKQSESTMHTITTRPLVSMDFDAHVNYATILNLNQQINIYQQTRDKSEKAKLFKRIKKNLPEGFIQKRMICTNYKSLRNIIKQRLNHRLSEWKRFCEGMKNLKYFEYLEDLYD